MEMLKSWAVCVTVSALAGTVISLIVPNGSAEKSMRAVIGIFIVSAVCIPLTKADFSFETVNGVASESGYSETADELYAFAHRAVTDAAEATVSEAATESGIEDYTLKAEIATEENGCIIIREIIIEIDGENNGSAAEFERIVSEKLGVQAVVRERLAA